MVAATPYGKSTIIFVLWLKEHPIIKCYLCNLLVLLFVKLLLNRKRSLQLYYILAEAPGFTRVIYGQRRIHPPGAGEAPGKKKTDNLKTN